MNSIRQKHKSKLHPFSAAHLANSYEPLEWLRSLQPHASSSLCPFSDTAIDPRTKRQREFQAGRDLAAELLSLQGEQTVVGVNQDRSPCWPDGFVGSISHSNHWVWVAVARNTAIRSIGIDTETIADPDTCQQVRFDIATAAEWLIAEALDLTPEQAFSVVFSAKEAFYKCWYPVTQTWFGFEHAAVESVTHDRIRIRNKESNPNAGIGPETLEVFFMIKENEVFTATWMENE